MSRALGTLTLVAIVAAATATAASRAPSVRVANVSSLGSVLVNANGRTLYHLSAMPKNVDKCTGMCAADWPPLLIPAGQKPVAGPGLRAALLGTIKHGAAKAQVTYAGLPLYLYSGDRKAGDVNGQGVSGVSWIGGTWYAISPAGTPVGKKPTTLGPAPSQPTVTLPGC